VAQGQRDYGIGETMSADLLITVPVAIKDSLKQFQQDYPDPAKVAFIMMRFGSTAAHKGIVEGIRSTLQPHGIKAIRADDKEYHPDLWYNILTYIHGCGFGVAVFERLEQNEFNPNVSLEVGYLYGLGKKVCLLKDKTLTTLYTDLLGKLYCQFNPQTPKDTIRLPLEKWMLDNGIQLQKRKLSWLSWIARLSSALGVIVLFLAISVAGSKIAHMIHNAIYTSPVRGWPTSPLTNSAKYKYKAKTLPELLTFTKQKDEQIRFDALIALGRMGYKAEPAIPQLKALLNDENKQIRVTTALVLWKIGPDPTTAVSALTTLLKDDELEDRLAAAEALGRIGPDAKAAVPRLVELLSNGMELVAAASALKQIGQGEEQAVAKLAEVAKNSKYHYTVRGAAIDCMAQFGPKVIPILGGLLSDKVNEVQRYAADALRKIGPEAVPTLTEALKDNSVNAYEIAIALGMIGPKANQAIPALTNLATPAFTNLATYKGERSAIWALGQIGPEAKSAVPTIIRTLADSESDPLFNSKEEIILALGRIGPDAKQAVPAIIKYLNNDLATVRKAACEALGGIGVNATMAVPDITKLLKRDMDNEPRLAGVKALGNIGHDSKPAIPILIALLKSKDNQLSREEDQLSWSAGVALGKIASSDDVHSIADLLDNKDAQIRAVAAYTLGRIGSEAHSALPTVTELLKDKNSSVRMRAARAIWQISPTDSEVTLAVPCLMQLLRDGTTEDRAYAAEALGDIRPTTAAAIHALAELTHSKESRDRGAAARALGNIGGESKSEVAALMELLRDEEEYVRRAAAQALGSIGPDANTAVALLTELSTRDDDEQVRKNAIEALMRIGARKQ
jgi:HEAT repeat protein